MSRFAALETLRAATARALALGTSRKPLEVPAVFERASRNAGNASALGLLAAMAVRGRFDRPSPPQGFAPAPPVPDASVTVRGPLRIALRRVFHVQNSDRGPMIRYNSITALPVPRRKEILKITDASNDRFL